MPACPPFPPPPPIEVPDPPSPPLDFDPGAAPPPLPPSPSCALARHLRSVTARMSEQVPRCRFRVRVVGREKMALIVSHSLTSEAAGRKCGEPESAPGTEEEAEDAGGTRLQLEARGASLEVKAAIDMVGSAMRCNLLESVGRDAL